MKGRTTWRFSEQQFFDFQTPALTEANEFMHNIEQNQLVTPLVVGSRAELMLITWYSQDISKGSMSPNLSISHFALCRMTSKSMPTFRRRLRGKQKELAMSPSSVSSSSRRMDSDDEDVSNERLAAQVQAVGVLNTVRRMQKEIADLNRQIKEENRSD